MKKLFSLIAIIMLMTSCASSKEFQVPMTEKMYQESKLEAKLIRKSKKKNFLKNYTKNFVNSIPDEDLKLMTKDTIIVVYDTTTVK
jgi:hypothetical protein